MNFERKKIKCRRYSIKVMIPVIKIIKIKSKSLEELQSIKKSLHRNFLATRRRHSITKKK